jgi:hypothetical protein
MDILSKLDLSYFGLRAIEIIRDQGGKNGVAVRRFESALMRSAKERELDFSVEAIEKEISSIESLGLISRPSNGMVLLTSVCRSLIGLRPYTSLDLKRLRERGLDSFVELLIKYGEEKTSQKPSPKKIKPAKVEVAHVGVDMDVDSADNNEPHVGGDAPDSKALSNDEIDYVNELLSEGDSVDDALSAIKSLKVKLNKPALPGVKNSSDKVKLIGALIDLVSEDSDSAPIISGLNEIKDDLVSNSID